MREFEIFNPWWYTDKWENEDRHIKEWNQQEIKWFPDWVNQISLKPFSLNFIIGPRQVGKTTGIKLLIRRVLEKNTDPKKIIYIDMGLVSSLERLKKIFSMLEEMKYIFLDEITSLEGWWKVLRSFIDAGVFKDKILIVTGSTSLELKKHAELFPGRRGEGKKIEVLPLLFPEYLKIKTKKEIFSSRVLEREFKNYLLTGGFPKSINSGRKFVEDLLSGFESESVKTGMDMETCYQIVHSLLKKMPSAFSYQSIGNDIGVSYKTVEHYIKTIKYLYFLNIAYWKHNNQISFRKEKKIFFRDPFIYHAFSFWTGEKFLESALYEGIVQEHLYRRFGEIFYYRNKYEIDCLAGGFKVEVKAGKPHRRYPKNVEILNEEDIPEFLVNL